ncbi:MAG TPA: DUF1294 domain-containing protein [Phycisphaerales bacterium]|nr:DUF1294 domain-containing protein [Phycisphaerales bacterium]HMP38670.1 DUF1294 domain-containing protein [Phycisphaerales bacterium]
MTVQALIVLAAVASVASFVAMAWDKHCAIRRWRRIPESTLHGLELLGGWPGSLLAQRLFRHKTDKPRYQIIFWIATIVNVAVIAAAWRYGRS